MIGLLIIVALVAGLIGFDVYKDRRHGIIVKGAIPVYGDWEPYPAEGQKAAFILTAGAPATVKRIRYGKSYMAVRIETGDGKTDGYFRIRTVC